MKNVLIRWSIVPVSLLVAWSALAQPQLGGPGRGFNASLAKMFGDIKGFSAQAEAQMQDKSGNNSMTMPMSFALLDGKMRMELDLTQMKSKQLPPEAMAGMKQMGLDKMVNIIIPEKNQMLLIYPSLKAYAEMPTPNEEGGASDKDAKIETFEVGKETVDGHPCVKNRLLFTDSKGKKQEGFTWNATDLKDFPVKMEFVDKDAIVTMTYKNIKMARPEAKDFDPPAGYTKHADVQQLMQVAMQRMIGAQGKPDAKP